MRAWERGISREAEGGLLRQERSERVHKTRPCGADGREVGRGGAEFPPYWQGYRMTLQEGRLKPSSSTEKTEAASSMGSDSRPGAH